MPLISVLSPGIFINFDEEYDLVGLEPIINTLCCAQRTYKIVDFRRKLHVCLDRTDVGKPCTTMVTVHHSPAIRQSTDLNGVLRKIGIHEETETDRCVDVNGGEVSGHQLAGLFVCFHSD